MISSLQDDIGSVEDLRLAPFKAKNMENEERIKLRKLQHMPNI